MSPPSQLTVLVVATFLVFSIVMHLRRRRLAAAPFVALLTVNLVLALLAMYLQPGYGVLFWGTVTLFGLLVVVPGFLAIGARRMVQRGEFQRALGLLALRRMLQPGAGRESEERAVRAMAEAAAGRLDSAVAAAEEALAEARGDAERAAAFEHLCGLYLATRDFAKVVARAEANGGVSAVTLSPTAGMFIMRSYAEVGEMEKAARCQELLESSPRASDPAYAQAMNAGRVAFLGHFGFAEELAALFAAESPYLPVTHPAHHDIWLGLAHARSGDSTRATQHWERAAAQRDDLAAAEVAKKRLEEDLEGTIEPTDKLRELAAVAAKRALAYGALPETSSGIARAAPVTSALLAAIGLAHLPVVWLGLNTEGLSLLRVGANFRELVHAGEYWRLITSMFLHGPWFHIGFNALALYSLGKLVEQLFGSLRFFSIYVLAGVAGSLASVQFGPQPHLSVGASGAIFGLVGAALAGLYRLRGQIPEGWRRHLMVNLLLIIGLQVWIGYSVKLIDNAAHYGGLAGGFLVALFVGARPRSGGAVRTDPSTAADGRLARAGLWALAAVCLGAVLASGALLATTPLAESLNRIGYRRMRSGGLSVEAPAHWIAGTKPGRLTLRDPLSGLQEPPALRLYVPSGMLRGASLRLLAERRAELTRESFERQRSVTSAKVLGGVKTGLAEGVLHTEVLLVAGTQRYLVIDLHKRQGDLSLSARVGLRADHRPYYEAALRRIAKTMRYIEKDKGGK